MMRHRDTPVIRRRALLAGGLATAGVLAGVGSVFAGPAPLESSPPGGIAIVMNSIGASVSIIDIKTEKQLREVPLLREPHHWTLSPDGTELWVGDASGNTLFALSPATGSLLGHRVLADPYQLWVSPDGRRLVVNALRLNHVDVYDAATLSLTHRFHEYSMPSHLAYSPDASMVYSTLQGSGDVVAIDLVHDKVSWRVHVGLAPAGIIWHQDRLLVALMNSNDVVMLDPVDGKVTRRIPTGRGAHIITVSPDRRLLYVTNRVAGTIDALDAETLRPLRRYTLSGGPDCIAFAPDGRLWITRRWADSLAVMEPEGGRFSVVPTGRSPHGIFLSPMLKLFAEKGRAALGTASL
ncbi:MAG: YncE family protein [Acetobacteraceae bacterium]